MPMLRSLVSALLLVCSSALVMPVAPAPQAVASRSAAITMGNNAPEGPFTPIVLAGKVPPIAESVKFSERLHPVVHMHGVGPQPIALTPRRSRQVVLGEKFFNKIRGKGIAIHSQVITEFCEDYGVPRSMRGALIKKAKITGGDLGFLN